MSDISKGTTFTNGVSASATDLNNLVDAATIQPAAITGKGAVTPDVADSLLIYDNSGSSLAKCTLQNVIDALPTDNGPAKSLRTLGPTGNQAAAGNDARFPASVTGIRKSTGAGSTDVAATPTDFKFPTQNINALTNIDFNAADIFYDTALSANKVYTFSNVGAGRSIVIQINQNGHTVGFPAGVLILGTPSTAGWNLYCITVTNGATIGSVAN